MKEVVQKRTDEIKGQGIKLQYFAAVFSTLHNAMERSVYLFLYLTQTGKKMQVEEYHFYQTQIL
jgi:anaerobic magnesium-protoporphyrin IX monomethyl ester cyclase